MNSNIVMIMNPQTQIELNFQIKFHLFKPSIVLSMNYFDSHPPLDLIYYLINYIAILYIDNKID